MSIAHAINVRRQCGVGQNGIDITPSFTGSQNQNPGVFERRLDCRHRVELVAAVDRRFGQTVRESAGCPPEADGVNFPCPGGNLPPMRDQCRRAGAPPRPARSGVSGLVWLE